MNRQAIAILLIAGSAAAQSVMPGLLAWIGTQGEESYVAPTNGLIEYWSLDGDANGDFDSINMTVSNAKKTNDIHGVASKAYYFDVDADDADGECLYAANNNVFDFGTGDFSVSAWFQSTEPAYGGIVSRRASGGTGGWMTYIETGGKVTFTTRGSSANTTVTTDGSYTNNTWYHMAAVKNGTIVRLFINGVNVKSTDGTSRNVNNDVILTVGRLYSDLTSNVLKGSVDEVRIYSRALTTNEVQTLYNLDKP